MSEHTVRLAVLIDADNASVNGIGDILAEATPLLDLRTDTEFQEALEQAIDAATPTGGHRAHLATVGNHLQKLLPEFDSRNYGFKKLSDLLSKVPTVTLTWNGEPPRVYVERP